MKIARGPANCSATAARRSLRRSTPRLSGTMTCGSCRSSARHIVISKSSISLPLGGTGFRLPLFSLLVDLPRPSGAGSTPAGGRLARYSAARNRAFGPVRKKGSAPVRPGDVSDLARFDALARFLQLPPRRDQHLLPSIETGIDLVGERVERNANGTLGPSRTTYRCLFFSVPITSAAGARPALAILRRLLFIAVIATPPSSAQHQLRRACATT